MFVRDVSRCDEQTPRRSRLETEPLRHIPGQEAEPTVGVYVHVPFCRDRCDYCAFATWTDQFELARAYVAACIQDIRRRVESGMARADTLFFGGGTPSLLPPELIAEVIESVPLAEGAEVTLEANPADASPSVVRLWRQAGVTRVSMGIQSPHSHVLGSLGRRQSSEEVSEAVSAVRGGGFDSWSVDLVYGAAGETDRDWEATIGYVTALGVPHVSAYALTVEAGTPLWSDPSRYPDDDVQASRYEAADEAFTRAGLGWYEVSNWAARGHECRHNLRYWEGRSYFGFGCAAHSYHAGRRWWNVHTPKRYIDLINRGHSPLAAEEVLTEDQRRLERLMLGLRTTAGVQASPFAEIPPALDLYVQRRGDRLTLTTKGRLMANAVVAELARLGH